MRTIYRNAFIYTGDAAHRCHERGAIAVAHGRIEWIGPEDQLAPMAGDQPQDLGGAVVMPGLINTHAHGGLSLHRGAADDGDLVQWMVALAPHTSNLTVEDNRWACHLAVFEMVRNGITTACDCTRYGAGVYSEVASAIGQRSLSGALANSPSLRANGRPNWPLALEETKAAIAARGDNPLCRFYLGAHSPYNCTPELLTEVKRASSELGLPFNIHVAESRREVEIVRERHGARPLELLHRRGLLDATTILAHCVWLDDDEIAMIADSGAGVAHNPISNGKLATGIAPVAALRARGIPVGLGTDSTLSNNSLSIFQEMKFAVLLQRLGRQDGFALGARDALAMATREGARVLSWEREIGSLEQGKAADMVVLDLDHPLGLSPERVISDLVYAAGPQHIRTVIVAGEAIFANGRFNRIDEAAIKAEIRRRYAEATGGRA
jgi:5-methylthioadenosine/S-adenosylhomocysteine deaminase